MTLLERRLSKLEASISPSCPQKVVTISVLPR